ncbi:uncharacterized protein N0V89_005461 [Didymosphaeria variabile]|uniref:FAD-binding PCMH-type domain-containing protein n=1 Tax=Didymosphaeria variabile TaxID=1932322 RepID=A0A9W8XL23_9PLEO|nr:uncharacterized protein N0V89_005461 [Didymosphaeria variabile]KAJ4353731.1 hypothetical protein N0V89_005461 [Didymosphaeria variabile]
MGDITTTETLAQQFPNTVLKPGSPRYEEENSKFWNRDNADIRPSAIVTPSSVQETASIVKILSDTETDFAIRSGGYMPVPGHNTSSSILISTTCLNSIELVQGNLVKFGAGNQWGSVYDFLEPRGLVVPGGRSRPVGVGGFLLHGGVSHFYAEVGWACEAVVEFEVALATGEVVVANEKENKELYWALKGGGKNFGIVTAFTMKTRELPKMWGGVRVAVGTHETAGKVFEAMHDGIQGVVDEKAHVEVISFFVPQMCQSGDPMFALCLAYAGEVERPQALKGFLEVEAVHDGTRTATQRELADDDKQNIGYDKRWVSVLEGMRSHMLTHKIRGLFRAFSYHGGPQLTLDIYSEYYTLAKQSGMFEEDPGAMAALLWLPAGPKLSSGTSVISLGEEAEPYLSCNICFRWERPEASKKMHAIADAIAEKLKKKVQDAGAFIPFTYANIAGVEDTTFQGLPNKTKKRLREVAARYDPQGVFQKQVPGFNLV